MLLFRTFGQAPLQEEIVVKTKALFSSPEATSSGIPFDIFLKFLCDNFEPLPSAEPLIHVFRYFDPKNDGK